MRIHLVSSMPHYARHLDAIWKHIPAEWRGVHYVDRRARLRGHEGDITLIGGAYDLDRVESRIIYVEHGAGQSYNGDPGHRACGHSNYAGGKHPRNVIGYIAPRADVAEAWDRPAFAAGCPALDGMWQRRQARVQKRLAVFTFHFDARICPESRSAREHYLDHLQEMVEVVRSKWGWQAVGHWHPKDPMGERIWRNLGIDTVSYDDVLLDASVLIADNTSALYEAAALDLPCVVLNAPWYRRDVEHGLRFWSHVPGPQIDHPDEFVDLDLQRVVDDADWRIRRREISRYVFDADPRLGTAGPAAAAWVCELAGLT